MSTQVTLPRYEGSLGRRLALSLRTPGGAVFVLAAVFAAAAVTLLERFGFWTYLLGGLVWMAVGVLAVLSAVVAKWVLVGRQQAGEHPLYSWYVWLNELQDQFVEVVAAPWFFNYAAGSGEMNLALRALGVRVGRGAWIESYWFPETDLCAVGAGASVGPGTVVQTHLFQDRVMSLDTVTIEASSTLGSHSVALPASRIGAAATVGVALPRLAPGNYTAAWTAEGPDGHKMSGSISFMVH